MTATKQETAFVLTYNVQARVNAPASAVWARLTDADGFARWNSTVQSLEGTIALNSRLTIKVPTSPGRAFTPRVVEFAPPKRMVWQDGFAPMFQGTRTFTLVPLDASQTDFTMTETFRGLMLPLIKKSLPDFRPVFDRYVADLQRACV